MLLSRFTYSNIPAGTFVEDAFPVGTWIELNGIHYEVMPLAPPAPGTRRAPTSVTLRPEFNRNLITISALSLCTSNPRPHIATRNVTIDSQESEKE